MGWLTGGAGKGSLYVPFTLVWPLGDDVHDFLQPVERDDTSAFR